MIKKITLTACEVKKEGVSASGKSWTMYDCRDLNTRYTSFTNFTDKIGIPTDYDVESKESGTINNKTGKPFVNYTISLARGGTKKADASYELLLTKMNTIEKKIDEIFVILTKPVDEYSSMDKPKIEDNDTEINIPF